MKRERSWKVILSRYHYINVPNPIYSHKLWNVTKSMRLWIKVAEKMVAGLSFRDGVRSSVILEELGVKLMILCIRRGKLS